MVDHVSREKRSEIMRSVRQKDGSIEMRVRSALHRRGLRFRVHAADLPGTPDIVLPRWKTVIFVNGCYWHRHAGCAKATTPKSNIEFWDRKFSKNVGRDRENYRLLKAAGWRVLVFWQCEITEPSRLSKMIESFF